MFGQLFNNIPPVVKNLLIINGLFFLATIVLEGQDIFLIHELGIHYPDSPFFEPYQLATHFFMHSGFLHILLNMFGLIIMGSHLERYWGPKRFLIFYFVTALGAAILHMAVQGIEVYQITGSWYPMNSGNTEEILSSLSPGEFQKLGDILGAPAVGASGAIFGLILAFGMLFPNTQFMLLFPPIPIKAKWLAIGLGVFALVSGLADQEGDSVAHFAHLGGMLFGFIMIKIWQRDKNRFY